MEPPAGHATYLAAVMLDLQEIQGCLVTIYQVQNVQGRAHRCADVHQYHSIGPHGVLALGVASQAGPAHREGALMLGLNCRSDIVSSVERRTWIGGEKGQLEGVLCTDSTTSVLGETRGSDVATFVVRDGRYGGVADLRRCAAHGKDMTT